MTHRLPLPPPPFSPRTSRLLLLLPLLATGCTRTQLALTTCGLVAAAVILFFAGFAISVEFCCRTYAHWETVVGNESRHDLLRLTDASTAIAREAEAAIRASRAALRDLRRAALDIR